MRFDKAPANMLQAVARAQDSDPFAAKRARTYWHMGLLTDEDAAVLQKDADYAIHQRAIQANAAVKNGQFVSMKKV